jgi:hypothetical protein
MVAGSRKQSAEANRGCAESIEMQKSEISIDFEPCHMPPRVEKRAPGPNMEVFLERSFLKIDDENASDSCFRRFYFRKWQLIGRICGKGFYWTVKNRQSVPVGWMEIMTFFAQRGHQPT